MNQKVLVALTVFAIILGVLNLTLLLIPNILNSVSSQSTLPTGQKTPLDFTIAISKSADYYPVRFVAVLPSEISTLFNCHVKLDYLTESGVWKTTLKDVGIVDCNDSGDMRTVSLSLDSDFDSSGLSGPYSSLVDDPSELNIKNALNIKVEAYGYLKP